jgi:hypothetical protein
MNSTPMDAGAERIVHIARNRLSLPSLEMGDRLPADSAGSSTNKQ